MVRIYSEQNGSFAYGHPAHGYFPHSLASAFPSLIVLQLLFISCGSSAATTHFMCCPFQRELRHRLNAIIHPNTAWGGSRVLISWPPCSLPSCVSCPSLSSRGTIVYINRFDRRLALASTHYLCLFFPSLSFAPSMGNSTLAALGMQTRRLRNHYYPNN